METIIIGCRLPHGLVLEVGTPGTEDYRAVELTGVGKMRRGAKIALTPVPLEVWAAWVDKNLTLRYVVEKSVFVA